MSEDPKVRPVAYVCWDEHMAIAVSCAWMDATTAKIEKSSEGIDMSLIHAFSLRIEQIDLAVSNLLDWGKKLTVSRRRFCEAMHQLENPLGIINNCLFSLMRPHSDARRICKLIHDEVRRCRAILRVSETLLASNVPGTVTKKTEQPKPRKKKPAAIQLLSAFAWFCGPENRQIVELGMGHLANDIKLMKKQGRGRKFIACETLWRALSGGVIPIVWDSSCRIVGKLLPLGKLFRRFTGA